MVDKFREFLQQSQGHLSTFYNGLSAGRKIAIGAIFVVILSAFILFSVWKPATHYTTAFSNLSTEDQNAILAELKKNNVEDFKLEDDTLSFPEQKLLDMKMLLAQEGLPSSGIGGGWEKFDDHSFGMSDFDQKISKLRALQGELARTINKLEGVTNSRVHIVLPETTIFANEKKVPTASIYLKIKHNKSLNQKQIQGIVHLVARAVEGMDPKNVTIIDQQGNMLTQIEDEEVGALDKVTTAQKEYQRKVEKDLESKIKDILVRIVGQDKVVTKVDAAIDFKKVEHTISDVDPERTAVIASQRNEQSSQGAGLNPTGVPGAKSNLPGEKQDLQAAGGLTNNHKSSTENLNYEVKKTVSKIIEPVGTITKLNASVLVDSRMVDGKVTPRTKEEMEMITKLVKTAIGFQDKRDSLTVESTHFEPDEFEIAQSEIISHRQTNLLQTLILTLGGIAILVFLYLSVVRPYFRWLTFDPEKRSRENKGFVEYEFEKSAVSSKRVQLQEEVPFEKLSPKEQIMYLAKNDPKKTTEAIRQMLNPHH